MISLKTFFVVIFLLTLMLMILGQTLPPLKMKLKKMSPYECGFDPIKSPRLPFSFRFFLVAILFLLFDLEMALLMPLPSSFNLSKTKNSLWVFSTFMMILTYGLFFEWIKGGLDWAKD